MSGSLSTSSKAPRFSPEAAPKYLKLPKSIQLKCTSRKLCFALGQRTPHEVESQVGHKDGVIIVDHGSRRKESNLLLNEFVLMFKSKTGYAIVEPAHMELAEPTIRDAFGSCVEQGVNRVIISPFFLFPGRHWHQVMFFDCVPTPPSRSGIGISIREGGVIAVMGLFLVLSRLVRQ